MIGYTTIEQSKKLVELGIDVDSADMYWATDIEMVITTPYVSYLNGEKNIPAYKDAIPCWSTESLLKLLPKNINHLFVLDDIFVFPANGYRLSYRNVRKYADDKIIITYSNDTLLNCAYNMIVKLKEMRLL